MNELKDHHLGLLGVMAVLFAAGVFCYFYIQAERAPLANSVGATTTPIRVVKMHPSPDGKWVAAEVKDGFTSAGGGVNNYPLTWLYISSKSGGRDVRMQAPNNEEIEGRDVLRFGEWLPDSSGVLVFFQHPDEATQGSAIYKVTLDGKIAKDTTLPYARDNADNMSPASTMPVFSPDGHRVVYIKDEHEVWLGTIGESKAKLLVSAENLFNPAEVIKWSFDGRVLTVVTGQGLDPKVFKFNSEGETIL